MAIKPILFNTEMVRAILDGRKTQTRRIVEDWQSPCEPGDIMWVQEMWRPVKGSIDTYIFGENAESDDWHNGFEYKVGGFYFPDGFEEINDEFHLSGIRNKGAWHPAVHMPKEAARIFLRVKDVQVEMLNDMSEDDAIAEGFVDSPAGTDSPLERYSVYWDKHINRDDLREYGWHQNPWVWVVEFERCDKPEGWCKR